MLVSLKNLKSAGFSVETPFRLYLDVHVTSTSKYMYLQFQNFGFFEH